MVNCCIRGCSNRPKRDKVSFFGIPKVIANQCKKTYDLSSKRRILWIAKINRKNFPDPSSTRSREPVVCGKHFVSGRPSALFDETNADWAPSLHLGHGLDPQLKLARDMERYNRRQERRQKAACSSSTENVVNVTDVANLSPIEVSRESILGDITNSFHDYCNLLTPSGIHDSTEQVLNMDENTKGVEELLIELNETKSKNHALKIKLDALENDCKELNGTKNENQALKNKVKEFEMNCYCKDIQIKYEGLLLEINQLRKEKKELEDKLLLFEKTEVDSMYLREENAELKSELLRTATLTEEQLKNDDKMVNFYTGLPTFGVLMIVYEFVQREIFHSHRNSLPKFKEFILTLMRIKLNVPLRDIAYRLNISEASACRTFKRWIDVLHVKLRPFIYWPAREDLRDTMPLAFRQAFNDKIAVIIDCFEVFIQRPSNMLARACTWSSYKHHNTGKYLIGITPQGTVSFISEGWGGRVSDKHLTEHCGILDLLLPGDVVMADRGFDIQDILDVTNNSLVIPVFMKNKDQLSMIETETSRNISNLRIHVERVIGVVRGKFKILNGTIPIEHLVCDNEDDTQYTELDKIVVIACALVNFNKSLVSQF